MEEQRKYLVYMHTCPNGKKYIGITCCTTKIRWGSNGCKYKQQIHFYRAIEKYGWDNIKHEVLFEGLTKKEACNKEIELIAKYNTANKRFGYNHTYGGDMAIPSEEARKNMGLARPNRKRVRCIELNKVFDTVTDAEKELNIAHTTIIACCRNKQHYNTAGGYHWEYTDPSLNTPEIVTKKNSHSGIFKPIKCVETNITYNSIKEASIVCNIKYKTLVKTMYKDNKYCCGYHWEYV